MAQAAKLVPRSHDEFSSQQYWDKFFKERGHEAFEWYGQWSDLRVQITTHTKTSDRTLVIGCGNSDFSTLYWQAGHKNIVNLDFSSLVIDEMKGKTAQVCPGMEWVLGDMTCMPTDKCPSASFNTVFDKGALDALLSSDSEALLSQARKMFNEIDRVLTNSGEGKYLCVTLAEGFILSALLDFFVVTEKMQGRFSVCIEIVETVKKSPLRPFLIVVAKLASSSPSSSPSPSSSTSEGLDATVSLCFDESGGLLAQPMKVSVTKARQVVQAVQQSNTQSDAQKQRKDMGRVQVGRFEPIELWLDTSSSSPSSPSPVAKSVKASPTQTQTQTQTQIQTTPRFTIYLIDASASAPLSCAVFFIPAGREAEWQFTTQEGLMEIAAQANCRCITHTYITQTHTSHTHTHKSHIPHHTHTSQEASGSAL